MSAVSALFIGLAVMLLVATGVLLLLRKSLHQLLVEICGEEHRARFWGQLYSASLLLTVGLAGILFPPEEGQVNNMLYSLLPMFRAALVGLLLCLGILAMTMVQFIVENDRRRNATTASSTARR
jgi:cytochrome bd-type quinol oxidase subunit 2